MACYSAQSKAQILALHLEILGNVETGVGLQGGPSHASGILEIYICRGLKQPGETFIIDHMIALIVNAPFIDLAKHWTRGNSNYSNNNVLYYMMSCNREGT